MKEKVCSRCGVSKPLSEFKSDSRKPDGKASSCKACNAAVGYASIDVATQPTIAQLTSRGADTIPFHPLADIFPLIDGDEFDELARDIQLHGLREPIILLEGQILDGRNRYRAGVKAGVVPPTLAAIGPAHLKYFRQHVPAGQPAPLHRELLAFVISKNLHRRQLTDDQRTFIAAELASGKWGGNRKSPNGDLTAEKAAEHFKVSKRGIERARTVIDHGTSELLAAAKRGILPVATAAGLARLSEDDQRQVLTLDPDSITRRALSLIKQRHRDARERDLGKRQRALPDKRYGVILADPEWRFEPYNRESGMDRAADNHYPTSVTDNICARPVASIAADDCVLFLWATVPMLPDALRVMTAWSFEYKSHCIWAKDRIGTGYWFRNQHEILLVGTRGDPIAPAMGTQVESLVDAPVGRHSEKPKKFYELIEAYFPNLPKIELNARGPARPGWEVWGNEAEEEAA